jgi:hypothetical protein
LFSTKGEPLLRILTTRLNGEWYLSAGLAVFQTLKEWYLSAGLADKICLNLRPESGTFAPEYPEAAKGKNTSNQQPEEDI